MLRGHVVTTAPIGGPYHWYFHFKHGDTLADAGTAASAVANFLQDIAPCIASSLSMQLQDDWDVIDVATGNLIAVHGVSGGSPEPGTDGGTLISPVSQGLLRLRTGVIVGTRELRGRLFIPGATENLNDGGRPTAGYRAAADAAATALRTDASTDYCVYSPTHGTAQTVITDTVWTDWAYLSSRRD